MFDVFNLTTNLKHLVLVPSMSIASMQHHLDVPTIMIFSFCSKHATFELKYTEHRLTCMVYKMNMYTMAIYKHAFLLAA